MKGWRDLWRPEQRRRTQDWISRLLGQAFSQTGNELNRKIPVHRSQVMVALLLLGAMALVGRMAYIQWDQDYFLEQSSRRTHASISLHASRGEIQDRNGRALAVSKPMVSIQIQPATLEDKLREAEKKIQKGIKKVKKPDVEALYRLAERLGMSRQQLQQCLSPTGCSPAAGRNTVAQGGVPAAAPAAPVAAASTASAAASAASTAASAAAPVRKSFYLRTNMERDEVKALLAEPWLAGSHLLNQGVSVVNSEQRVLHEPDSMRDLLGKTDIFGTEGISGLEKGLNASLKAGRDGQRRIRRAAANRPLEVLNERPPEHGQNVRLTLDSQIQYKVWQALKDAVQMQRARSGSAVVLDPKTGQILALANYARGKVLGNQALQPVYEPGSIIKPLVVAQALQEGRVRPETVIHTGTSGVLRRHGATIKEPGGRALGSIPVSVIIEKSSNIGMALIGDYLTIPNMWKNLSSLGLGQKVQLPFEGAAEGTLHAADIWLPVEKDSLTRGYFVSASLFQMVHAYAALANDGVLWPVTIVLPGQKDVPASAQAGPVRLYSPAVARQVRRMLWGVTQPRGTGPQAQAKGYHVGGKTGTASKRVLIRGGREISEEDLPPTAPGEKKPKLPYSKQKKNFASFVGMAPIEEPRIVVGVMLNEPQVDTSGGRAAAPVFSRIVEQVLPILNVDPDIHIQPVIVADPLPEQEPE